MQMQPNTSLLARYTARARTMSVAELTYAIGDVKETLTIWRDRDPCEPYNSKLWAEFDAYTTEICKRRKITKC